MFSRREMLAATAAGGVVTASTMNTANATPVKSDITFGNPNDPRPGAINAKNPRSITNPGPQNPAIRDRWPRTAGDIGYVKKNLGHYIKNNDTDLQFLEVFKSSYFADIALTDWISRTPPVMAAQHVNVSEATIAKFPRDKPEVMPE